MFDQSTILAVAPPVFQAGTLFLRWQSSSPPGTIFQVYVATHLSWSGTATHAEIAAPEGTSDRVRIDIGTVGPGEKGTDFSYLLVLPADRAQLAWLGGRFEAADLGAFAIFGEPSAGAGIDYSHALATVAAFPGQIYTDGYGFGGYGHGGYGYSSGQYGWTSGPLWRGTWSFAVVPLDTTGNYGDGATIAVNINVPPRRPAACQGSDCLCLTYDEASRTAVLSWARSPDDL